jgi:hypothetical protein
VVGNIVPLVGVLYYAWDVATILCLSWLENSVVGLFAVWRIRLARLVPADTDPHSLSPTKFFMIHYGGFTAAHGLFVSLVVASVLRPKTPADLFHAVGAMAPTLLLGCLALLWEHANSFYFGYVAPRAYERTAPDTEIFKPYPRLCALHFSLLIGVVAFGSYQGIVLVLIALHLAIDLIAWTLPVPDKEPGAPALSALDRVRYGVFWATFAGLAGSVVGYVSGLVVLGLGGFAMHHLGYGDRFLDNAPRWALYPGASLGCFGVTLIVFVEVLEAFPAFKKQDDNTKRLIWAMVLATVTTTLVIWRFVL